MALYEILRPGPAPGSPPTRDLERALRARGHHLVAGIDEVGRGPLAGPVVAGAVILDPDADFAWQVRLRDSKLLSGARREELAALIWRDALAVGVAAVPAARIDSAGIAPASREAMAGALAALGRPPGALLLDAFLLPESDLPQQAVIHGDACCAAISAASIVAKVARDRMMVTLDRRYPGYGFAANRGYGTAEHLAALCRLGPSPIHRRNFAPLRNGPLS